MADAAFFDQDEASLLTMARRRRHFTLEQANRMLPLVKRIVNDITRTHAQARAVHAQLDLRISRDKRLQVELDLDRVVQKLQHFVDELNELGVSIRDYAAGQIDFPSRHRGREIFFCWQPGEDRITQWHFDPDSSDDQKPIEMLV